MSLASMRARLQERRLDLALGLGVRQDAHNVLEGTPRYLAALCIVR